MEIKKHLKNLGIRKIFWLSSLVCVVGVWLVGQTWAPFFWVYIPVLFLIMVGCFDMLQKKHTIKRNYPVIGHIRYFLEKIRPEIRQYFVESDTEGKPINRMFRTLIYQRSKNVSDTTPFGTKSKVYQPGYEWMNHSIYAKSKEEAEGNARVLIGGENCTQKYSASLLNISAMSFGSLSNRAVLAMNKGAKMGNFAQNTGEGGISPYHLEYGADLIWQIGTGYFGCRNQDGSFSDNLFAKSAQNPKVKMIELKLSQGAKPGHGGILPAHKNTKEIAAIRMLEPFQEVESPSRHRAFQDAEGLLHFIEKLRNLSGGKPVGFKICIGNQNEFDSIGKAMVQTGILPDFITIDGGEGGTGAAPVEFTNSLGFPLRDGLAYAHNCLEKLALRGSIKIIASGAIYSGFHMARSIALGANLCYTARAMMMATGCIQALQCNANTCPTGVATQNPSLVNGLVVEDKAERVAHYHQKTVSSFLELMTATGLTHPSELNRTHIYRRIDYTKVMRYDEIYPYEQKVLV